LQCNDVHPNSENYTYAGYRSPKISLNAGVLYEFTFKLSTNEATPADAPRVRLRLASECEESFCCHDIFSYGASPAHSLTTTPRDYTVYYRPTSFVDPDVHAWVELINFGDGDDDAGVYLHQMDVKAIAFE
jgi:hypothetical protein